ncbi:terminase large subunit domain-containing protein [Microbacterium sp. NPDC087589]|uniref:terminase large subunit domain-containing protein n=1 Tax=Microbacterium sp. NPDC087589 TaxID=3364191 RepID=UPI003823EB69
MSVPPFADIEAWPPPRYTPPLTPDFESAFDPYAKAFAIAWVMAFSYALEEWQVQLIRAVLEVYPPGHARAGQLRWQQAVISLGRQNGKTEIAAALGLWRLLSKPVALVIGIASNADQAGLVYDRARRAIDGNPEIARMFTRTTETRGLRMVAGGSYKIKAARSAALQGLPIDLGLVDELHLLRRALWGDLLSGTGGRPSCLVAGITTAGDSDSELLLDLYRLGEQSIADGGAARVFFAAWEAPEARIPDDDETLGRWLAIANPAVASGRTDLEALITLVRTKPPTDAVRYHLNRFLTSTRAPFIEPALWMRAARRPEATFPRAARLVFSIDATPGLGFASIVATARTESGEVHSELVASLRAPSIDRLLALCLHLWRFRPATIAVDGYTLRALGKRLAERGIPTMTGSYSDAISATAMLYRLISTRKLVHGGDPLRTAQMQRATRKNAGDAFVISRADSGTEVDAIKATALGVLALEVAPAATGVQVF